MKDLTLKKSMDLLAVEGTAELEAHVQRRVGSQVREFRVVVTGKGLHLRGRAHTYYAKQLAQQAVMEASALPIVANEIEVA